MFNEENINNVIMKNMNNILMIINMLTPQITQKISWFKRTNEIWFNCVKLNLQALGNIALSKLSGIVYKQGKGKFTGNLHI